MQITAVGLLPMTDLVSMYARQTSAVNRARNGQVQRVRELPDSFPSFSDELSGLDKVENELPETAVQQRSGSDALGAANHAASAQAQGVAGAINFRSLTAKGTEEFRSQVKNTQPFVHNAVSQYRIQLRGPSPIAYNEPMYGGVDIPA